MKIQHTVLYSDDMRQGWSRSLIYFLLLKLKFFVLFVTIFSVGLRLEKLFSIECLDCNR